MNGKTRKVLFRVDDYAENRNHDNWAKVLEVFNKFSIKVCIGVIPDNRDKKLLEYSSESSSSFWAGVSDLDQNGHVVALHGCTHEYHSIVERQSLIPINPQSEFVGLKYSVQLDRLSKSLSIFAANGFVPKIFMAPSHTFDEITLRCLSEVGIKYVTDGYFLKPVRFSGIKFIPQQFGSLYRPIFPLQTICLHPNTMKTTDISELEQYCSRYRDSIIDFTVFESFDYPPRGFLDVLLMSLFHLRLRI